MVYLRSWTHNFLILNLTPYRYATKPQIDSPQHIASEALTVRDYSTEDSDRHLWLQQKKNSHHFEFDVALQLAEVLQLSSLHVALRRVLSQFRQLALIARYHQFMLTDLLSLYKCTLPWLENAAASEPRRNDVGYVVS